MTKPLKPEDKKPAGRQPTPYDPAQAAEVLRLIEDEHLSMRDIWGRKGIPTPEIWRRWMDDVPGLYGKYARARESLGDAAVEEIKKLAMETTNQDSNANRVKIDALKWYAAKMRPRAYGDKLDVSGQVISASITVDAANLAPDQRAALRALLGSAIGSADKPGD